MARTGAENWKVGRVVAAKFVIASIYGQSDYILLLLGFSATTMESAKNKLLRVAGVIAVFALLLYSSVTSDPIMMATPPITR